MKLGLIGYPLGHSWSPVIHKKLIDMDYDLIPLQEEELQSFMERGEYDGFNVTIPYKQKIMKYLDEIDPAAKKINAINCVVKKDGKYIGYNTDYLGFQSMLNNNISIEGKKVAVLGSGGASKAVVVALEDMGGDAVVVSRLAKDGVITYEDLYETQEQFQVIVNTTPVGMFPHQDESPIDLDRFTNLQAVVDIVANPLRTKLVFEAKCRGLQTCGGFEMLVGQALHADEFFLDTTMDRSLIQKCMNEILEQRRNIVLIGMPTSGKSTIARELGKMTGRQPVEMDDEIVKILGTSIAECFADKGEAYFRSVETSVARENRNAEGKIISCGGGVIKIPETMRYLSENGIVLWIHRDLESLFPTDDRPLASDIDHLRKLYSERQPLYEKYHDVKIDNNGSLQNTLQTIMTYIGMEK